MSVLLDFLYRQYCQARLAEIRKHLLLIATNDVSGSNCVADHAERTPDRQRGLAGARHETHRDKLV